MTPRRYTLVRRGRAVQAPVIMLRRDESRRMRRSPLPLFARVDDYSPVRQTGRLVDSRGRSFGRFTLMELEQFYRVRP
jgi:hypothetical protein